MKNKYGTDEIIYTDFPRTHALLYLRVNL